MKLIFKNAEKLNKGLSYVLPDFDLEALGNGEITVNVKEVCDDLLKVSLKGENAEIIYGGGDAKFFRGVARLIGWIKAGVKDNFKEERRIFTTNGSMIDMSRNAVMNVKTVKFMMRKMALMGQNMFMLYTEDTYEIDGRPYFGHLRGRYTSDEIRELDAYALALGIELIPCIQVLGHLATNLQWASASAYRDTSFNLLVGAEETYKLIDDMFKTISENFTTKRIHIGMDETHDLGRGSYLNNNGYVPREEIYFEHLKRVKVLLDKYGFKPMMWSDMFFRLAGKGIKNFIDYDLRVKMPEGIGEKTQGIQQVFWDYYNSQKVFYTENIEKHKALGDNTIFAGGIWCWSGFSALYSRSLKMSIPALDGCKEKGIKEVISTVWHNGSECSLILALAGIAWYADYDFVGYYDEESVKECFFNATGYNYDDFMTLEEIEKPIPTAVTVSRTAAYCDPLTGVADAYFTKVNPKEYYAPLTKKIRRLAKNKGEFTQAFKVIEKISSLFELKVDFGIRLREAYLNKDKDTLLALAKECDEIIRRIKAYRNAHRASWIKYNRAFGWEIHDIRIGGVICRFDTAKYRINAYLNGEIEQIEELEADRLFLTDVDTNDINIDLLWQPYENIALINII